MTRDDLIRETNRRGGSWPAIVGIYALILLAMVLSGMMMVG